MKVGVPIGISRDSITWPKLEFERLDTDFPVHPRFRFDVDLACRIVTDQKDREPRRPQPRRRNATFSAIAARSACAIAAPSMISADIAQSLNTTVFWPFAMTRSLRCHEMARARTLRSISRPLRTRSSGVSWWLMRSMSCSMMGLRRGRTLPNVRSPRSISHREHGPDDKALRP
jgi:hypothetical protein